MVASFAMACASLGLGDCAATGLAIQSAASTADARMPGCLKFIARSSRGLHTPKATALQALASYVER